jgi:5,10-methylenetetrahydromethanopterin reductase
MLLLGGNKMSARAFGIELYGYTDAPTLLEEIQLAEQLGFESVWLGDSQLIWRDLYVMLGAAAATTSRVALATGVTNPVTRHPAVTASAIMTLQELTRDRAILGVGVGFTSLRMMGQELATRAELRRFVTLVRALCNGEAVAGEGGELRLAFGRPGGCPPVVIPASGPKMLRLAGEIADGVMLQGVVCGGDVLAQMQDCVRGGREAGGRADAPFRTYITIPCAVSADRSAALAAVKAHVAVALLGPRWPVSEVSRQAVPAVRAVYDAYEHMSPSANAKFAEAVPDASVPEFAMAGTPAECIARAEELFAGGVDEITVRPYGVNGESRLAAMEAFAREVMAPMQR